MLHGRDKIGTPQIEWERYAFGRGKYRRKTIGFGRRVTEEGKQDYEFSLHVRELSIVDAGIGCAVWDAAIILSRWIFDVGYRFMPGHTVLELGSGVGLPGLMAAYFADRAWLSDYLPQLLCALEYNLKLNNGDFAADDPSSAAAPSSAIAPASSSEPPPPSPDLRTQLLRHRKIAETTCVALLDWNRVHAEMQGLPFEEDATRAAPAPPAPSSESDSSSLSSEEELEEEDDLEGKSFFAGFGDGEDSDNDAAAVDNAAEVAARKEQKRAAAREQRRLLSQRRKAERRVLAANDDSDDSWIRPRFRCEVPAVDIIIGSELTYTPANVYNVISVMRKHLKEDGVFYEIVSEDRDGMALFLDEAVRAGFSYHRVPVPRQYLGDYGTRQKSEQYLFYTLHRADQPLRFPIMGQPF